MTPRETVAALLAQAREDGILLSRLAIRSQRTIASLEALQQELARLDDLAAARTERTRKPAAAGLHELHDYSRAWLGAVLLLLAFGAGWRARAVQP